MRVTRAGMRSARTCHRSFPADEVEVPLGDRMCDEDRKHGRGNHVRAERNRRLAVAAPGGQHRDAAERAEQEAAERADAERLPRKVTEHAAEHEGELDV